MRRWWLARGLTRRFRHARQGEENARSWLERHGFTIVDAQASQGAELIVDGVPAPFVVRADYLVERNGVRAVVEVKTGAVAQPAARATRRQVLEYGWVYGVSEVYLFDADAEVLRRIELPAREPDAPRPRNWTIAAFAAGIAIGVMLAWLARR